MTDRKLTLLELHFDGDGGPSRGLVLLGLFVLVVLLAAVARALRGDDELDDLAELDDFADEG